MGLRGFDFNFFDEEEEGVGIESLSYYPYLLMLMNLWPGYWKTQLRRTKQKVDEDNGI